MGGNASLVLGQGTTPSSESREKDTRVVCRSRFLRCLCIKYMVMQRTLNPTSPPRIPPTTGRVREAFGGAGVVWDELEEDAAEEIRVMF